MLTLNVLLCIKLHLKWEREGAGQSYGSGSMYIRSDLQKTDPDTTIKYRTSPNAT